MCLGFRDSVYCAPMCPIPIKKNYPNTPTIPIRTMSNTLFDCEYSTSGSLPNHSRLINIYFVIVVVVGVSSRCGSLFYSRRRLLWHPLNSHILNVIAIFIYFPQFQFHLLLFSSILWCSLTFSLGNCIFVVIVVVARVSANAFSICFELLCEFLEFCLKRLSFNCRWHHLFVIVDQYYWTKCYWNLVAVWNMDSFTLKCLGRQVAKNKNKNNTTTTTIVHTLYEFGWNGMNVIAISLQRGEISKEAERTSKRLKRKRNWKGIWIWDWLLSKHTQFQKKKMKWSIQLNGIDDLLRSYDYSDYYYLFCLFSCRSYVYPFWQYLVLCL